MISLALFFRLLRRAMALSWKDRALLFEAFSALALSSSLIALLPFRLTTRLAGLSLGMTIGGHERTILRSRIRWALLACARRAPWRALCFQQGLAAQWMLRRRGIPSVLYYGVAHDAERGLFAHVWVRDGDFDVVGGENASQFAILTTFPAIAALD